MYIAGVYSLIKKNTDRVDGLVGKALAEKILETQFRSSRNCKILDIVVFM